MFKIGSISLKQPLLLAPLAGISDLPFRLLNRSFGCGFAFSEMISARALVYQNAKTRKMLFTMPEDRPLGIQLLGSDPDIILKALDLLQENGFDLIDLNAACPVKKVTSRGEGAALLKEPERLYKVLRALTSASKTPVSVKIRTGWDPTAVNAAEIALRAQDAGANAVFIHGRTRAQGYAGSVDYKTIREVKESVSMPVIASGDALTPQLIKKLFDETGCDAVAIARGALGNPWIFRHTADFLETGVLHEKTGLQEIADTMTLHLSLCLEHLGSKAGPIVFRKFFGWYTKGIQNIKPLKEAAFHASTGAQMQDLISRVSATAENET